MGDFFPGILRHLGLFLWQFWGSAFFLQFIDSGVFTYLELFSLTVWNFWEFFSSIQEFFKAFYDLKVLNCCFAYFLQMIRYYKFLSSSNFLEFNIFGVNIGRRSNILRALFRYFYRSNNLTFRFHFATISH